MTTAVVVYVIELNFGLLEGMLSATIDRNRNLTIIRFFPITWFGSILVIIEVKVGANM